jgi:hypothetical protein
MKYLRFYFVVTLTALLIGCNLPSPQNIETEETRHDVPVHDTELQESTPKVAPTGPIPMFVFNVSQGQGPYLLLVSIDEDRTVWQMEFPNGEKLPLACLPLATDMTGSCQDIEGNMWSFSPAPN